MEFKFITIPLTENLTINQSNASQFLFYILIIFDERFSSKFIYQLPS